MNFDGHLISVYPTGGLAVAMVIPMGNGAEPARGCVASIALVDFGKRVTNVTRFRSIVLR